MKTLLTLTKSPLIFSNICKLSTFAQLLSSKNFGVMRNKDQLQEEFDDSIEIRSSGSEKICGKVPKTHTAYHLCFGSNNDQN